MATSSAIVPTVHATSYLRQLCRHWSHRFTVEFSEEHGSIALPTAVCTLDAEANALKVRVEMADGAEQERVEGVIAEHLERFRFKEMLVSIGWS